MNKSIVWRQYRDERNIALPKKLAEMIPIYRQKTGSIPTVIGLPSGYSEETRNLLKERFDVQIVVPRWAGSEIWLGTKDERDKQDGGNHASL